MMSSFEHRHRNRWDQNSKPQEIKSSIGKFEFADSEKSYPLGSEEGASIHVLKNADNSVVVNKTILLEGSKVHCRLTIPSNGEFNRLVIFSNKIKWYQTNDASPQNFNLPETINEIEDFVNAGGTVEFETVRNKKILNDPSYPKYHFEAVGKKVFMKGQNKEVKILSFDKDIDTIFSKFIVFTDGTVKELSRSLYDDQYTYSFRYQIEEEIRQECKVARDVFINEVENIEDTAKTSDGYKLSKLLVDIDQYLQNRSDMGKFDPAKKKVIYEKLSKLLKEAKNPKSKDQIIAELGTIMLDLKGGAEDIAVGVISIVAGALLVCVAFALIFLPVMLLPTLGAGLAPALIISFVSTLMLLVAGSMIAYGLLKLGFDTPWVKDFQYNKNVSRLSSFFKSGLNSVENANSANSQVPEQHLSVADSEIIVAQVVLPDQIEGPIKAAENPAIANEQRSVQSQVLADSEAAVANVASQELLGSNNQRAINTTGFNSDCSRSKLRLFDPKTSVVENRPQELSKSRFDGEPSGFKPTFEFFGFI